MNGKLELEGVITVGVLEPSLLFFSPVSIFASIICFPNCVTINLHIYIYLSLSLETLFNILHKEIKNNFKFLIKKKYVDISFLKTTVEIHIILFFKFFKNKKKSYIINNKNLYEKTISLIIFLKIINQIHIAVLIF